MYEGNHRLLALNALGAPYVPFMGRGKTHEKPNTTQNACFTRGIEPPLG